MSQLRQTFCRLYFHYECNFRCLKVLVMWWILSTESPVTLRTHSAISCSEKEFHIQMEVRLVLCKNVLAGTSFSAFLLWFLLLFHLALINIMFFFSVIIYNSYIGSCFPHIGPCNVYYGLILLYIGPCSLYYGLILLHISPCNLYYGLILLHIGPCNLSWPHSATYGP